MLFRHARRPRLAPRRHDPARIRVRASRKLAHRCARVSPHATNILHGKAREFVPSLRRSKTESRRRPVRILHANDAGFHAKNFPRIRCRQKHVARHALDRKVLIEDADNVRSGKRPSIARRTKSSKHIEDAANVFPEPVGAVINTLRLARIKGQPCLCGCVGSPYRLANHSLTSG
jgi:hypothetical protein